MAKERANFQYMRYGFIVFVTRAVLNPCHQTSPLPNSTLGLWNQETIYLFPSPMFFSRTSATATTMLKKTLQFILDVFIVSQHYASISGCKDTALFGKMQLLIHISG